MPPTTDSLISTYRHMAHLPRASDALLTLKKVASLVKPIMRARNYKVGELVEFIPEDEYLHGLNINRGQKICLRLRPNGDKSQFLAIESVIDTMLHELCHNVYGPHNSDFNALWDKLRDELQGLMMKGYTGEGFLSAGQRLGGSRIPKHEARRLARIEADRRKAQSSSGAQTGQRLGGRAPARGKDIRAVIAGAAERRNRTLQGCGTERLSDVQIVDIADSATRNGFRTQAEEDEANEAAIAQALWELVQEDEKAKHGESYIPPSAADQAGKWVVPSKGGSRDTVKASSHQQQPNNTASSSVHANSASGSSAPAWWDCQVCTLRNSSTHLSCDACGSERPSKQSHAKVAAHKTSHATSSNPRPSTVDLTGDDNSPPRRRRKVQAAESSGPAGPATWRCGQCGMQMERQWWTCATCGKMKESSI